MIVADAVNFGIIGCYCYIGGAYWQRATGIGREMICLQHHFYGTQAAISGELKNRILFSQAV
jgi:hypothetical protein